YPLPTSFSMTQNLIQNTTAHSDRSLVNRDSVTLTRNPPPSRAAGMTLNTAISPIDNMSFSVSSIRDLTLKTDEGVHRKLGPINMGREISRNYGLSFSQNLKFK